MSDISIDGLDLPNRRMLSELRKWDAEFAKLQAEQAKFNAETQKIQRERSYYPIVVLISGLTSGAALFGAGAAFWKVFHG